MTFTPHNTNETSLSFGTSVFSKVDDSARWPHLHDRVPSDEEVGALDTKLQQLFEAAGELKKHSVARSIDQLFGLEEIAETEPYGVLRTYLPALLLETVEGALATANLCLFRELYEDAVAQLRYAEVQLRLAHTWGMGMYESCGEPCLNLSAGETTPVRIDTEVETVIQNGRPVEEVRRTIS